MAHQNQINHANIAKIYDSSKNLRKSQPKNMFTTNPIEPMCLFESSIFTPRDDSKNVFTPTGPNAFAGLEMGNGVHEHLNTD